MDKITVICNVPHEIAAGDCALCQRDAAMQDARRYRMLRSMVGVLNLEIGRLLNYEPHSFKNLSPEDLRAQLDAALDRQYQQIYNPPPRESME